MSVYIGPSSREREKKREMSKNVQSTPLAAIASAVGPCPTVWLVVLG